MLPPRLPGPAIPGRPSVAAVPGAPSLRSRLFELYLRLARRKQRDHHLAERIAGGWHPQHAEPPLWLHLRHRVERRRVFGCTVWTLAPAGPPRPPHVLFLHGGAYVNGLVGAYWRFLARLADATGGTLVIPEYPLAPAHHPPEVLRLVLTLYRELGAAAAGTGIAVMGASSGGGIALALAQQLRRQHLPPPGRLVLVSPWLDASMCNPALVGANRRDPLLDLDGLGVAGRLYAGDRAADDPLVSPIYGSLAGLPPTTVLVGTHDLLLPDARRFRDLALAAGVALDYQEYPGMVHEWTLAPIPEAAHARARIAAALRAVAAAPPGTSPVPSVGQP